MDGNGRLGRFLMNVMMAAGGYPWTVIPVAERKVYLAMLEKASVGETIAPFAEFLAALVEKRLAGEPLPEVPSRSTTIASSRINRPHAARAPALATTLLAADSDR